MYGALAVNTHTFPFNLLLGFADKQTESQIQTHVAIHASFVPLLLFQVFTLNLAFFICFLKIVFLLS